MRLRNRIMVMRKIKMNLQRLVAWKFFLLNLRVCVPVLLGLCSLAVVRTLLKQGSDFVEENQASVTTEFSFLRDSLQLSEIDKPSNTASGKRRSLIIVAHGRSGSTFIGNIFNHHPSVFYLFEPYQTVERISHGLRPYDKGYQEKSFEWMKGALQCDFVSPDHVSDLYSYYTREYDKSYDPIKSIALLSPPFCLYNTTDPRWTTHTCPPFDQKTLEDVCKKNYNVSVAKVLIGRMPEGSIKQLLSVCESETLDCKVLFLVRDPRGIVPSSRAVGFFRYKDSIGLPGTRHFAYKVCRQTELNLELIKTLSSRWKRRFLLLRYEDLAVNPLNALPGLLEFAGLPMRDSLTRRLYQASHAPDTQSERNAARWRQDSWEGAERWRWKVAPFEITIIESYCKHVMRLLGYKPVDKSYELQRNLTVRLLEDDFPALKWFNPQ